MVVCGAVKCICVVGEADAMDSARSLKAWNSAGPLSWTSGWLSSQALCMDVGRSTLVRHVLYMSVVHAPENTACMLSLPDLT